MDAICTVAPHDYIQIGDVQAIIRWFEIFIDAYISSDASPVGVLTAVTAADCMYPFVSTMLRVRCRHLREEWKTYQTLERLVKGSLELVDQGTIDEASQIPIETLRRILMKESTMRMDDACYRNYDQTPPTSVEDDILDRAMEHVVGRRPGPDERLLFRVAVRIRARILSEHAVYLKNDITSSGVLGHGMSVHGMDVVDEFLQVRPLAASGYSAYLLCSAS